MTAVTPCRAASDRIDDDGLVVTFDDVWIRIRRHAGEEFRTVRGLLFTYRLEAGALVPDRTEYRLGESTFRTAFALMPLSGPGQISKVVRGPSYVFAILTDPRICG